MIPSECPILPNNNNNNKNSVDRIYVNNAHTCSQRVHIRSTHKGQTSPMTRRQNQIHRLFVVDHEQEGHTPLFVKRIDGMSGCLAVSIRMNTKGTCTALINRSCDRRRMDVCECE